MLIISKLSILLVGFYALGFNPLTHKSRHSFSMRLWVSQAKVVSILTVISLCLYFLYAVLIPAWLNVISNSGGELIYVYLNQPGVRVLYALGWLVGILLYLIFNRDRLCRLIALKGNSEVVR